MVKEKCDDCQIKEIDAGSEGVHVWNYRGDKSKNLHLCYECYTKREEEYLQNYVSIYTYEQVNYKKKETGYLKNDNLSCYAGQKSQNGEVLKQVDCRHCQPWKFPNDNGNQEKCANCSKVIKNGETKYFGNNGKVLCSNQCVEVHNDKDKCSVCGKNNPNKIDSEGKIYCSSECLTKGKSSQNNRQQNPPPKFQNNNKEMSNETKIVLGIVITVLIFTIGVIGVKIYKKSQKKTS